MKRKYQHLTDGGIEAVRDFLEDGPAKVLWDEVAPGLQVRCGRNRITFAYQVERRTHGARSVIYRRLGFYPTMNVKQARAAALMEAGRVSAGRLTPGKRAAVRFEAAFVEYLDHLKRKAEQRGKPPSSWRNAKSLGGRRSGSGRSPISVTRRLP